MISCPEHITHILQTLQAHGHQAVLAGGCVRDSLLSKIPHDWDVATDATPEQVEKLFPCTYAVGRQFGIIVVHSHGVDTEVAMFRGEGDYTDGRHPGQVFQAPMEEDAKRRDFTINAMMYDPLHDKLYDFTGGQEDLQRKIIRTVGNPDHRFQEDKLRLLRAIRFAAKLKFSIDNDTWQAIKHHAPEIAAVSEERIAQELTKMLLGGHSATAFDLLLSSSLLAQPAVLPEVAAMHGVPQPPQFHPEGDVWTHTLLMLRDLDKTLAACRLVTEPDNSPRFTPQGRLAWATEDELTALAWATLLHDVGKPRTMTVTDRIRFNAHDVVGASMAAGILRRLKQSTALVESVHNLVRQHMRPPSFKDMRLAHRRRFLQEPWCPLLLELFRLDCASSHHKMDLHIDLVAAQMAEASRPKPPAPLLNGNDLKQFGLKPGPQFRIILEQVRDLTLEGKLRTREDALAWLQEHIRHFR